MTVKVKRSSSEQTKPKLERSRSTYLVGARGTSGLILAVCFCTIRTNVEVAETSRRLGHGRCPRSIVFSLCYSFFGSFAGVGAKSMATRHQFAITNPSRLLKSFFEDSRDLIKITSTTTMRRTTLNLAVLTIVLLLGDAESFVTPHFAATATATSPKAGKKASPAPGVYETKNVVTTVAVAGATGQTGRLVVEELLSRGVQDVVAIARNASKAEEVFPNPPENLKIVMCDLTNERQIESALKGVDAAIWCATGFSDSAPDQSPLKKLKRFLGLGTATTKQSIDDIGLPAFAKCLSSQESNGKKDLPPLPKVVMCSSSGVTRPAWDAEKKKLLPGAADIPIVRLNPFGILDIKRGSEEKLRETGSGYCIVRPGGLNDKWPAGSRPVFSQGDVAVGRINRKDVAKVLVDVLSAPEATGKTFEVIALAGYPKSNAIGPALSRLINDKDGLPPLDSIVATYNAMQQLIPGEEQDSAALAMGQTYEQLDKGETGRLGKRGEENAEAAAPKPSS
jgi:uncharacterized protein YbjT (DUF2867 family)